MDMQKITVNGKNWKEVRKELSKEIKASDMNEYASKVEQRLFDVLGANYSLETNMSVENGKFLSHTALLVRCDSGEVISRRDGHSCSEDCSRASIFSLADAANRYGVQIFVLENTKKPECHNVAEVPKKASEKKGNNLSDEDKIQDTSKNTVQEETPEAGKENGNASDNEAFQEFIITSAWSRTKMNQFWCSVHRVNEKGEEEKEKKILVVGEDAQRIIYSKLSAEPTDKISVISPRIYAFLKTYESGERFNCVAELKDDREYILVDIPN